MRSAIIPYAAWTDFTPTLPQFYWDVYSAEQRIKHICYELCKMHCYSDYLAEQLEKLGTDTENELAAIKANLEQKQNEFQDEILKILSELTVGSLQWDVQYGKYESTVKAQRDMFNDVTVHSYNNEQLETIFNELDMTVDKLANCGLNVKGYALMNHLLKSPTTITSDLIPDDPNVEGMLTINDLNKASLDTEGYVFVN